MYSTCVYAKNRPSPWNEDDYIRAYKKAIPNASSEDCLDIAAVITRDGIYGHALMNQSNNRSRDDDYHLCYHFVSDNELIRYM